MTLSISNLLLVESLNFNLLSVGQLCDLEFKCIFGVDDVEIISVDGSNRSSKALDIRIYTWLISMLVKLNCQHACSLSLVWVGYDIEGLVLVFINLSLVLIVTYCC
jgi:hypothetical protein